MPRGKDHVGVADGRVLHRRLHAPSKRHSPSTPPSWSPVPSSWLPTGIAAHLYAWPSPTASPHRLIPAHRCELRWHILVLLSPTANGSWSNSYWVPQVAPNNGLVFKPCLVPPDRDESTTNDLREKGSITERVLARTLGAKLSTILHLGKN
jgi:hypothetical protein